MITIPYALQVNIWIMHGLKTVYIGLAIVKFGSKKNNPYTQENLA